MLHFEESREFGNGKRYNTSIERKMRHNGSIQENVNGNSSENVEGEVSEIQTLTQEAVNQQIKVFIAPFNPPARGVDSAGARNGNCTAS